MPQDPHNPHNPRTPNAHPLTLFAELMGGALNPANAAHGDAVYTEEAMDRIITQMMEQHNASTAPGPATAAAIAALPRVRADKSVVGTDGKAECSVCMDIVKIGDEVTMLPCKHWFHGECVGAWLREHDTCPQCRQGIMPKDGSADTPRSPEQAPRHSQTPIAMPNGAPAGPSHVAQPGAPHTMPGAFVQPGMQQPYVPGGYPRYPEPQQHVGQQQQSQQRSEGHRRRPSASQRSRSSRSRDESRGSGEGSSGSQGVTGWFRSLRGGGSSSDR